MNTLIQIQSSLRRGCHVSVAHCDVYNDWKACISTEGNQFPYWLQFHGKTPEKALFTIQDFLSGRAKDHARANRQPSDFLKQKELVYA